MEQLISRETISKVLLAQPYKVVDKGITCEAIIKTRAETMVNVNSSKTIRASNKGVKATTTTRPLREGLDRVFQIQAMGAEGVDLRSNSKQHNRSPTFSGVKEVALKRMGALARESNLSSLSNVKVLLDLRFKATNFNRSLEWAALAQVSAVEPSASNNHSSNFKLSQRHQGVTQV